MFGRRCRSATSLPLPSGATWPNRTVGPPRRSFELSSRVSTWIAAGPSGTLFVNFALDENPVRRDRQRAGLDQPDMPVNAGAFVKPPLELRGIHADRHRVLPPQLATSVIS